MRAEITIEGRVVGAGHAPFVIAELSGNHNGDICRAIRLMDAAKACGVDAVKLQTYTADTITLNHSGPGFVLQEGPWAGRSLHDLYSEAHTPWDWHPALFEHAKKVGLICFSSPFDFSAVDFLQKLGAPAYKIASFEIVDIPLIEYAARLGKPLIVSTGMATKEEIGEAVTASRAAGNAQVALLHCVSGYPTPAKDSNLRRIGVLAQAFDCPIGLSDHSLGIEVAIASVALGAAIIEKHLTLARQDGGPDAEFSLEPAELAALVTGVKTAFVALGEAEYDRAESERGNVSLRRSLYVVQNVAAGEKFTGDNVRSIRPGFGLAPKYLPDVLGRCAKRDIARGTPLSLELIE